jgi:hypothetical protein
MRLFWRDKPIPDQTLVEHKRQAWGRYYEDTRGGRDDQRVQAIHALLAEWRETADFAELNDANGAGVKVLRVCIDKLEQVLRPL